LADYTSIDLVDQPATPPSSSLEIHRNRLLLNGVRVLGGVGALCALTPFIASWNPTDATKKTGGPVQVDLSQMQPGQKMTVEWRGKPIWIIRRTPAMLAQLEQDEQLLRDPESREQQQPQAAQNHFRSIKPEYLVLVGLCTHLGCSPVYKPNGEAIPGRFFCPCHGSQFDMAGRVYKHVPAPTNLEVPPYRFIQEHVIEIGAI